MSERIGNRESDSVIDPAASDPGENYYRRFYVDYLLQSSEKKLKFYQDLVEEWAPDGPVFELGVGLGLFLERLSKTRACSGCDVNAFAVQETARRVPGVRVRHGSFESLEQVENLCAVVSWDVLEHIPDLSGALERIRVALSRRGVLIGVVPVYDGPLGWVVRLLDKDPTHVWKLGRSDWMARLEAAGFQVIAWGGILRKAILARWYLHLVRPAAVLRLCGSAIWFVARSPAGPDGPPE